MAEPDGNRTRRTGITRPNRFEGAAGRRSVTVGAMKKLLLLAVLAGLAVFAVRKLRTG